jgi:hypothetical protein
MRERAMGLRASHRFAAAHKSLRAPPPMTTTRKGGRRLHEAAPMNPGRSDHGLARTVGPKMAKAFFKMSRWRLTAAISFSRSD